MWSDYVESECRQNYSYFASADYLRNAYHITAIFTVPLSLFTFYAILRVTPKRMQSLRLPLLIHHISSTNLDLLFTVLTAPMLFFPSASGVTLGVFGAIGIPAKWQAYWAQVSIIIMGVCFVMLYENRHSQITTIKFKITSERVRLIYFGLNYFLAFALVVPFYLDDSDQSELRKSVLRRIPCPTIEFFYPGTYVLLKGGETLPFLSITGGSFLVVGQTLFFLFHTIYHLICASNSTLSQSKRSLQLKVLGYMSVQISIPLIALFCPTIYSLFADKYNYYNQTFNNNAMLAMANHGLISTSCTLLIYKPYRDHVKHVFAGRHQNTLEVTSVGVRSKSTRMTSVSQQLSDCAD